MEDVEDVQEWMGLNIMDQFKSNREHMVEVLLKEMANRGDPIDEGYEFDDVAFGGGCTFRVRANIPNPPNDGDQHEARLGS
jgi:hypothetical protein